MKIVIWGGGFALVIGIFLITAIKISFTRAERFWVRYLHEHGPTRWSKIPRFLNRMLPIEQYRRDGIIELDEGLDPTVQLSGYMREVMRKRA